MVTHGLCLKAAYPMAAIHASSISSSYALAQTSFYRHSPSQEKGACAHIEIKMPPKLMGYIFLTTATTTTAQQQQQCAFHEGIQAMSPFLKHASFSIMNKNFMLQSRKKMITMSSLKMTNITNAGPTYTSLTPLH